MTLTLDELIRRAIHGQDAAGRIAYIPHMSPEKARKIATESVAYAVDDWEFETGVQTCLSPTFVLAAIQRVVEMGWDARDARIAEAEREEVIDAAGAGREWE